MPRLVAQVRCHSESARFRTHERCRTGASHFVKDAPRRPPSTSAITQVTRHQLSLGMTLATGHANSPYQCHVTDYEIVASFQVVLSLRSPYENYQSLQLAAPLQQPENLKGGTRFLRRFWCPANSDSHPVSSSSKHLPLLALDTHAIIHS